MDFERSALPGIGLLHVFTTRQGRRVGVVSHRSGRRDLVVYDADDPDSTSETVVLTVEEADGLAELLAASRIVERLADLERQVQGLVSERIPIEAGSPYDGRTLGDTRVRTRTGASIVAVVRGREVLASPTPGFAFAAGDVVVVVGTAEGTAAVADILSSG
ncbi:cation:proton antiporter regulatory subunit [Actinomadura alba]|uniref:Cation:proton antiporter regulatory subunit n=1 Tax=Actinomadura alba TaxID=406431 RepID=A0ABR7LVM6_9ACTN|nr:cation:proton antiporter regulatory subunit [Actinomadura alba]MBC6468905.1 cation:proton antiporter regulatory subunit [Actinomadura alba]